MRKFSRRFYLIICLSATALIVIYLLKILLNVPNYKLNYDELKERRSRGHFDNILLRYLVELTNFLNAPETPCTSKLSMIILVTSACKNEEQRQAIRDTWGSNSVQLKVPVLFFVGQCPNARREIENFHDVVESDFVDSYYNNTLKSLARLRWYNEHCSSSDLVVMLDDDVIVNIDLMVKYLPKPLGYSILCRVNRHSAPIHWKDSKWYVPPWALRDARYPTYCSGSSYVINASAIVELYRASLDVLYLSIDDAIFTGYAAEMIELPRINDNRFLMVKRNMIVQCDKKGILAAHDYSAEEMKTYWTERKKKCHL